MEEYQIKFFLNELLDFYNSGGIYSFLTKYPDRKSFEKAGISTNITPDLCNEIYKGIIPLLEKHAKECRFGLFTHERKEILEVILENLNLEDKIELSKASNF
ncbi:hypothetical protein J4440_02165 [Candidatus Woesearchaeota archaeon]|nr:hypothetical protein [Candidatus Woesearchaeota archaeon]